MAPSPAVSGSSAASSAMTSTTPATSSLSPPSVTDSICPVEVSEEVKPDTPVLTNLAPANDDKKDEPRKKLPVWLWPTAAAVAIFLAWLLRPSLPPPQAAGTTQLTHDSAQKVHPLFGRLPLVTDGSKIYFQEITSTSIWPLMQVSTEGGETARIDVPLPPFDLSNISPEGHELLFDTFPLTDGLLSLYELSLPALAPRRVGGLSIAWSSATLSPDGRVLYYASRDGIFAAAADGSHSRKLLTAPTGNPFWLRCCRMDASFASVSGGKMAFPSGSRTPTAPGSGSFFPA